jgi:DNA recombination protein RmuC
MDYLQIILFIFIALSVFYFIVFTKKRGFTDEKQWEAIKELEKGFNQMLGIIKEIKGDFNNTSETVNKQIFFVTKETTEVKKQLESVQEIMKSISSFQEIFKTPKLRGEWGEASLDYILAEYFPKELYLKNYKFSSGAQVEFVLKLPNGKILPIDAKFFSDNFERLKTVQIDDEINSFRKKFVQDVKFNIQEISSKYIIPSENTVDFALMFIPAEAIFYEIMFNLREEDIPGFARSKKVILTSPNTIYLLLRTILDWFKDVQVSKKTKEIIKRLSKIQEDSGKLAEDFRKLGTHLRNASSAYDNSERRLMMFSDKVDKLLKEDDKNLLDDERS